MPAGVALTRIGIPTPHPHRPLTQNTTSPKRTKEEMFHERHGWENYSVTTRTLHHIFQQYFSQAGDDVCFRVWMTCSCGVIICSIMCKGQRGLFGKCVQCVVLCERDRVCVDIKLSLFVDPRQCANLMLQYVDGFAKYFKIPSIHFLVYISTRERGENSQNLFLQATGSIISDFNVIFVTLMKRQRSRLWQGHTVRIKV